MTPTENASGQRANVAPEAGPGGPSPEGSGTYRCTHWRLGEPRCTADATHRFAFAGRVSRIVGAACEKHGRAVVAEYDEKAPEMAVSLVALEPEADVVDARDERGPQRRVPSAHGTTPPAANHARN